jgi:hypothetical protein
MRPRGRRRVALLFGLSLVVVLVASAWAKSPPKPKLSVSGHTLHWTALPGATKYELQEVGTQSKRLASKLIVGHVYSVGDAPAARKYRVREVTPSAGKWSNTATVVGTAKKEKEHEKEHEKPKEEPEEEPEEEPKEEESGGPIVFSPGIGAGVDLKFDVPGAAILGAKEARVEVEYNDLDYQPFDEAIAQYVAKGVSPLVVYDFTGKMPSQAQIKEITALAEVPGVKTIEFGNETSYGYQYGDNASDASYKARARTYAERFVEASKALKPFGVRLLAQASPGNQKSPVWVDEMFAAEPELAKYVGGWTIHPYGPLGSVEMEEMIVDLAKHGDTSLPIDITEWGVTSDNGRTLESNVGYAPNMTYAQAATTLKEAVAGFRRQCAGRLQFFMVYQVRDQQPSGATTNREAYFGALQHEDQKKVPYTEEVQAVMKE